MTRTRDEGEKIMTQTQVTQDAIRVQRRYEAPIAAVWHAFTDAQTLKRWYAPVDGWIVSHAEVDLREGGTYEIRFGPAGGEQIVERATYVAVDPPRRLVFRLALSSSGMDEATEVTIELTESAGGTEVVVSERGYSSEEAAQMHARGWNTALSKLEQVVG